MKSVELRTQQEACADAALASYNFGDEVIVEAMGSWQRDTFDGKDDWVKVVYARCTDADPDADTHRISFHAAFVQDTLTLDEAYAYWCDNGSEVGTATN